MKHFSEDQLEKKAKDNDLLASMSFASCLVFIAAQLGFERWSDLMETVLSLPADVSEAVTRVLLTAVAAYAAAFATGRKHEAKRAKEKLAELKQQLENASPDKGETEL